MTTETIILCMITWVILALLVGSLFSTWFDDGNG